MNFTSCFCRSIHNIDIVFKSTGAFKFNYLILETAKQNVLNTFNKNRFLKYQSTLSDNSSLVKQQMVLPKKRLSKKKKQHICEGNNGLRITAFSTAEEYNLENLSFALPKFTSFKPTTFGADLGNSVDVVHAKPNLEDDTVQKDLFFFRDGCVVMWNISDSEVKNILNVLRSYEENSFISDIINNESEVMTYVISDSIGKTQIIKDSLILSNNDGILLEKYSISNAMALSVHLGSYEALLEQYIETMGPITEDLKAGNKIKMSRNEVLQKTGQLFALRHNINLNSDLLDIPDFYWDREELESLYQNTINYYCINKRTRVINEKINHCIELVELLSSHLNDKHHVRLEWMIIVLIMVEVGFEFSHYLEHYMESQEK